MRSQKFKTCLAHVLRFEGVKDGKKGNVDHPKDPGGRTSGGILQRVYDKWRVEKGKPKRDVWDITAQERETIYWEDYWAPLRLDDYPLPIAFLMFDAAVLNGINFSRKNAQKTVGVRVDNIIGPITRAALRAVDKQTFAERFQFHRRKYLTTRKAWPTFGKGWLNRMDAVEKIAADMIKLPTKRSNTNA